MNQTTLGGLTSSSSSSSCKSTLFSLPIEVIEKILIFLKSHDLKNVLCAVSVSLASDEQYCSFRDVCQSVLEDAEVLELFTQTHPVISRAVRRLKVPISFPHYGRKIESVVQCLNEAIREGDYKTEKVVLEQGEEQEDDHIIYDFSTDWVALWRFTNRDFVLVEVFSSELTPVTRLEIERMAKPTPPALFDHRLIWLEHHQDQDGIHNFLQLNLRDLHSTNQPVISVTISKFLKEVVPYMTKMLVSSQYIVTYDSVQVSEGLVDIYSRVRLEFPYRGWLYICHFSM